MSVDSTDVADTVGEDQQVAVIGLAGRFPGAADPDEFWRNVAGGVESITRLSDDDLRRAGVTEERLNDPGYVRAASVLAGVDQFDATFFGFTPLEASVLDPQHRLLLECTQALFDNAGYDPFALTGSTGTYVGVGFPAYLVHNLITRPEIVERIGMQKAFYATDKGFAPTRISHKFDLTGPSIGVDTACSTSLVAVHQACRALLAFECDLAVAGGASVLLPGGVGYTHVEGGILSPDGHCRAFDARAGGTVFGSGVGLVLLKRLDEALADGDDVRAVIRGSAVNNDGAAKAGFTAPSAAGQAAVIAEALAFAGVSPETIGYVEAHGTATVIGDPIEIAGLTRAYRAGTDRRQYCAVGSVKTNVGHLDVAAGVAGLIKTVQALRHAQLPPTLHWERPNPAIDFAGTPFYVNDRLRPWTSPAGPRRAGVSSFGIGGTNAHVVLEEAADRQPGGPARPGQLIVLSAHSATALARMATDLVGALRAMDDSALPDAAFTLSAGRREHSHRQAVVCRDRAEAIGALEGRSSPAVVTGQHDRRSPNVAFLFPGQGAQQVQMLGGLYADEPKFRYEVDRCAEHAVARLGVDLRDVIYPSTTDIESARSRLDQTWLTQPALFVVSLALARLWMSWGVRPSVLLGHSLGEYVAATVAGVFSVHDALELVIDRARSMDRVGGGAMLAVALDETALVQLLGECSLAAVNDPMQCVASGSYQAIEALRRRLSAEGVEHRALRTSHAFHSAAFDDVAREFEARVAQVDRGEPAIAVMSCMTGRILTSDEIRDPAYWRRQMRETVRFSDALRAVANDPRHLLLEVGPGRTLAPMARRAGVQPQRIVVSAQGNDRSRTDREALLSALGELFCAGVPIGWNEYWSGERRLRIPLPGHPFERQRHWIDAGARTTGTPTGRPTSFVPVWRPAPIDPLERGDSGTWLVTGDDEAGLGHRLKGAGRDVVPVRHGIEFAESGDGFLIDPARSADIDSVLRVLEERDQLPSTVVITCRPGPVEDFDTAQRDGTLVVAAWLETLAPFAAVRPIHVVVVSDRLHALLDTDAPSAAKATLVGLCRAAAEQPGLALACLDSDDPTSIATAVVAEIAAGLPDGVVAYRAGVRHVESYEPQAATTAEAGSHVLTNGFSPVAQAIARRLAAGNARLTLVGEGPVPGPDQWPDWLDEHTGPALAHAAAVAEQQATRRVGEIADVPAIERSRPGDRTESDHRVAEPILTRLCGSAVYETLAAAGVDLAVGRVHQRDEIAARMRIRPKFDKFLDFFLDVLHEDGTVRRTGDRVEVLVPPAAVPPADFQDAAVRLPDLAEPITFLQHCVRHYPAALSGDVDAVGVLFPDGDPKPLEAAFRVLLDHSTFRPLAEHTGRLLARLADADPGRPLRILEIGAGNGQLTRIIAPMLRGRRVQYWFTDLGGSFVRRARRDGGEYGFADLRCTVFDVTKDPLAQGIQPHSFDVVLGFDVVHATARIADTVANLRDLLAPGGSMCLVEAVVSSRWVEMLWGLAEGWWYFEDHEIRRRSPLVALDTWDRVLGEQPFAEVVSFPREQAARTNSEYGLIVARQPETVDTPALRDRLAGRAADILTSVRAQIDFVEDLRAQGARVRVDSADPTSAQQITDVVARAVRQHGEIDVILHVPDIPADESTMDGAATRLHAVVSGQVQQAEAIERAAAAAGVGNVTFVSTRDSLLDAASTGSAAVVGAFLDGLAQADSRITSLHWNGDDGALVERAIGVPGVVVVSTHDPAELSAATADRRRQAMDATEPVAGDGLSADDVERELLVLFRQLFGIEALGPDDDFYLMGGDSLLASQAVARVRRRFVVDLPVSALLDAPTVAGLAEKVRQATSMGAHTDVPLERVARENELPLSIGQQSLWLAEQFHGPSATYNIPGAVRLKGRLQIEALRRALHHVVRRHEVLRTTVHDVDGAPVQRIHGDFEVELPVSEIGEDRIEELAQQHARSLFDIAAGPLIRVALLRVSDEDHVLLVNIHHLVSDGWSLGVLVHELVTLYSCFANGEPSPLPLLDHQYVDFAQWQRRWLEGKIFDEQLAFWRRRLAGLAPVLELPADRPRPDVQRIRNAVSRFVIPPDLAARLVALGRAEGATLFMVLLTGFKVLLARYAGTTDIAVGTTNANRTRAVFEQMIGMFVNNLVLRTDLAENPTFLDLVTRVRTTCVDAYAHQDLPFLTLVDALRLERDPRHTPLFQVLFLLQKLNITFDLPGITAQTIEVDALHTKFDLTLFMEEQNEGITGTFIYNAELFDASRTERMAAHLVRLLTSAVHAPEAPIDSLRMETDDEARLRTMTESDARNSKLQSLRGARRRSVEITRINPVRIGFLPGMPELPLLVEPAVAGVDLPGWLRANLDLVEEHLHRYGALLLRGFHGASVAAFEETAGAICPTLFREYGDLPHEAASDRIYKSTPYPADRPILFHNESSHLSAWPMRQFFSCVVAPRLGGETPIVDCRTVYARLRPELVEQFATRRLRYVRNFIEAMDVSWSRFYGTDDPAEVERKCAEAGAGFEWGSDGTLRTWLVADAVRRHPRTGEMVFFNQLALHHASCLDAETRKSLVDLYGEDGMPRNVYWGDGTVIDDDVVAEVRAVMDREALAFAWHEGDVLVLDNMLVAHSRRPFTGPRKIVVALGDMMTAQEIGRC